MAPSPDDKINQMPDGPQHLGEGWRYLPLKPATDEEGRKPAIEMPHDGMPEERYKVAEQIWNGSLGDWPWLHSVIAGGHEVGIFPAPSGLVLLDCDVKAYDRTSGHVWKKTDAKTLTLDDLMDYRYGIDDLIRVVGELGHSIQELATYSVKTKSDGLHLYFAENPRVRLNTQGHRENWRVDVIAHNDGRDRSWAAAPPTAGYSVARDLPVLEMPDWLACWLRDELPKLPKPGGTRRQSMEKHALEQRDRTLAAPYGAGEPTDGGVDAAFPAWQLYVSSILELVKIADQHGGWNNQVYASAKDLFTLGYPYETVVGWLTAVSSPWTDGDRRTLERTARSAQAAARREAGQ